MPFVEIFNYILIRDGVMQKSNYSKKASILGYCKQGFRRHQNNTIKIHNCAHPCDAIKFQPNIHMLRH